MGKAELPPVAMPVKEGKTALLPSFPGFVFEPRLILGDSTFLQCAAAKNSHASGKQFAHASTQQHSLQCAENRATAT